MDLWRIRLQQARDSNQIQDLHSIYERALISMKTPDARNRLLALYQQVTS